MLGTAENVKQCCGRLYESDIAQLLLGDSFHPGGVRLTERLGILLGLNEASKMLDVASGKGASAIFVAERFGCAVTGVDYSNLSVEQATSSAAERGLLRQVQFQLADAERLPFENESFDALICECAFCTFPDKRSAAREFARVLRKGGSVGLSDLTRSSDLPEQLCGLLAWISCIADAQPLGAYEEYLTDAGFRVANVENHNDALVEMVHQVRLRLLGVEIAAGLKKLELPNIDFAAARTMARAVSEAIDEARLGYAVICGIKI